MVSKQSGRRPIRRTTPRPPARHRFPRHAEKTQTRDTGRRGPEAASIDGAQARRRSPSQVTPTLTTTRRRHVAADRRHAPAPHKPPTRPPTWVTVDGSAAHQTSTHQAIARPGSRTWRLIRDALAHLVLRDTGTPAIRPRSCGADRAPRHASGIRLPWDSTAPAHQPAHRDPHGRYPPNRGNTNTWLNRATRPRPPSHPPRHRGLPASTQPRARPVPRAPRQRRTATASETRRCRHTATHTADLPATASTNTWSNRDA
jgi:hypothetical protein